ncbi:hypothetical protein AMAG_08228 [Allomyces macrogynus ATCC 38327]|uniref:Uncharacterized protein n=1 Tax=Allomyces macrogynus (strain ATCC 38327) TaxID=578462 RepID=A0A0L0SKM3_ALLM3|nr:hypothetical protein AMAG_08228 [Allomyces macrogynus ATCC 38327]|eukprot:KNE63062.1 hypothetical protein AMAG_08228 [Allomyces macrogynus ATCC 38327]
MRSPRPCTRAARDSVGALPALLALIAATLAAMAILNPVAAAVAATSTSSDAPAAASEHGLAPRGPIAPLLGTPWVMLQSFESLPPYPTAMVGTPPVLEPLSSVKIPTALQTRIAIAMDGGAVDNDDTPPRATKVDATASARLSSTVITAAPTLFVAHHVHNVGNNTIAPGPRALPPPARRLHAPRDATSPAIATPATAAAPAAAPAKPTSDVDSGVADRYRDAHLTPEQVANVETHGTLLQIVGTTDKPAWWTAVEAARWAPVAGAAVILAATVGGIVGWRRVRRRRRAAKGEMVGARDEEGGVATASDAMLAPARS